MKECFGEIKIIHLFTGIFILYYIFSRIRHNVIKFGLRNIYLSYSRISLIDICGKLHLDGVTETEYTVAKAIRDGVIDATINHEEQYVQTKVTNIYIKGLHFYAYQISNISIYIYIYIATSRCLHVTRAPNSSA